ncbi:hypothetical protein ACIQMV_08585 [Streptomyces sp. NPDC091412]|uniref:hypothetical protein n=1 Tax=Streptomyces sp. NPDC091412 TaxID=3366002 RepID=UPI00381B6548
MTTHICDLSPSSEGAESARELLWRHGLPEDIIDGALCLHAQELVAVQRAHVASHGLIYTGAVGEVIDLIDPTCNEDQPAIEQPPAARADAVRDDLLHAIDFAYCNGLGYGTPEELLAAYDATRTGVDRSALRDRIAAALVRYDWNAGLSGRDTPSEHHYGEADAVLAVLPEPADRAAVLREAYEIAHAEGMRLNALEAEIGVGPYRGALAVAHLLRKVISDTQQAHQMADETAATETPGKSCAHCGQPISRVIGTLTAWWVHAPGGNTVCNPEQAASSPRATPKVAAEAQQDGAQPRRRCAHTDVVYGRCIRFLDNHEGECDYEHQPPAVLHAIPLPGSNGISACCGRPPCEFIGERVTRNPDEVTCTGPTAESRQDGSTS